MNLDRYRSGSTEPTTVEVLCALIRAHKPHLVVETGTFLGLTTRSLYEALVDNDNGASLQTVEHDLDRFEALKDQVTRWPGYGRLGIELTCQDALEFLRGMSAGTVDFVFLDDDHTAEHVRRELQECMRIVRPGGLITGHDVIGPFGLDAVFREFGGIALPLERMHTGGGLGIIVR